MTAPDLDLNDRWHDAHVASRIAKNIPPRYLSAASDRVDTLQWIEHGPRGTLYLHGQVGVGKTYEAYAVIRRFIEHDWRPVIYCATAAVLLQRLRPDGARVTKTGGDYAATRLIPFDEMGLVTTASLVLSTTLARSDSPSGAANSS